MCQFTDLSPAATGKLLPISTVQIYKMHRFWVFDQKSIGTMHFWIKFMNAIKIFSTFYIMERFFFMFISKKAEKIAFFHFFLPGLVKVFKN